MESSARSGYTVRKAACSFPRRPQSEVRLPQGLRFTDVRRSTIGDFPVARGGPRASKSHGRLELRPPACLLYSLRLPSAAAFQRANLRLLLDRVSRPERPLLRTLRRHPPRAVPGLGTGLGTKLLCALPDVPARPAALCAGGGLRALSGPHESRHPRAQVRPASSRSEER